MDDVNEIKLKKVLFQRELQQALAIRRKVFGREQGIAAELDFDGRDEDAIHVLAFRGKNPVATGRLIPFENGEGEIARIAVLQEARDQGFGKLVVQELEKYAREAGIKSVFLHPHDYLEKFYANLGYEKTHETITVMHYRLVKMRKSLS